MHVSYTCQYTADSLSFERVFFFFGQALNMRAWHLPWELITFSIVSFWSVFIWLSPFLLFESLPLFQYYYLSLICFFPRVLILICSTISFFLALINVFNVYHNCSVFHCNLLQPHVSPVILLKCMVISLVLYRLRFVNLHFIQRTKILFISFYIIPSVSFFPDIYHL